MKEKTFCLIKPDAFERNIVGKILDIIEAHGFQFVAMRFLHLSETEAEQFYIIHKDKDFYHGLCKYMSEGPVLCMVLEKENAIADLRKLMGVTDPDKAEKGTIRNEFGIDIRHNSIHGSDSPESVKREITFFFKGVI
ncbi:MAG TPA: nucleoside-diphosphate kinase [Firmicutes bacterium]|uniref:Nucleoside diphosphate kinase n=1 Tax=candidate division TA06 bacterium TaxID=2250710 RepID=A0A660SD89_UNCT6|nr:nucleoside-diphosphate kinase [candidate division WOR-3 bacterium]RKX68146.1 MAG: nucleoside-diphosphate kinase [candidate division TA06 bacterium]HFD04978.1 nucleoside-diphosphate kinase [Bacillota bacterium]